MATNSAENEILSSNNEQTTESNATDIKQDDNKKGDSWPIPVLARRWLETTPPEKKSTRKRQDPMTVERANLLYVCKLVIKELIDSSLSHGRMLDDDHVPLQQFFVVLEHVLRHGLKPKKGILRDKREFWCVLEQVEKFHSDAGGITISVKEMPNIKSSLGRARAWIRLALMQKKLADYFGVLVEKRDKTLVEFYEEGALMLTEEAHVIAGMLVGLNVIDCNIAIKDEDLDHPMGVIDFSLYLKNNFQDEKPQEDSEGNAKMAAILDQKNYLEELNTHLNATVTNLQQKVEALTTANTLMKEDLAIAKNNIVELQTENSVVRGEHEELLEQHRNQLQTAHSDMHTERKTYETSRQGLDDMFQDTQKKLREETQLRMEVERELELQISMKQETEMALRLLEKDIHEKQDSIVTLRKQLDDIKGINLQMYNKLQGNETALEHKTELVVKLEEQSRQMGDTIRQMEQQLKLSQSRTAAAEETSRKLGQHLADKDAKRSALETDLKIEREWRGTLQHHLESEKEKSTQLQSKMQELQKTCKDHEALQADHSQLTVTCKEQESALAELGSHLSKSKLQVEDLREAQQSIKEAQWADDKEITHCRQCDKPFSLSRRKHHCRSCGEIFCQECSDSKLPLPSSAKPVRVCDPCHTQLLQRYSAN